MNSVAAQIENMDATPDKVEAEIGWRVWVNKGGSLHSVTKDVLWPKGKELLATCRSESQAGTTRVHHRWGWCLVSPKGEAKEIDGLTNEYVETLSPYSMHFHWPGGDRPPKAVLPCGYSYQPFHERKELGQEIHHVPSEYCSCGIYASDSPNGDCLSYLDRSGSLVFGKVRLWGRVVPGSKGWRAALAYPEHLYVLAGGTKGVFRKRQSGEAAAIALAGYGVPVDLVSHWNEVLA